ncbi:MAG: hypothetical protein O3A93_11980 [Chloroflexi bacterium]|nr:hypothetical protein [Chloroflexota bacterium]MDA1271955.1 hypothetical protein [Chloroflexota bacterium]PKB58114.1 MAG: hypothetical protein BZY83_08640 [SAR202 cluster bacterium Casp-Chloro-G2]
MTNDVFKIPDQPGLWVKGGGWLFEWLEVPSQTWPLESGDTEVEWALVYRMSGEPKLEVYDPLSQPEPVYLAFADLGKAVWDGCDRRLLDDSKLDADVQERFETAAGRFIFQYGPPVDPGATGISPMERSVHHMLRQAQLVDLAVRYLRVRKGEEDTNRLRSYLQAAPTAATKNGEELSAESPIPTLDSFYEIVTAAEAMIDGLQTSQLNLGGLGLAVRPPRPDESSRDWTFELRFEHLLSVIWYQTLKSIVLGTLVRACRNVRCRKPGRLFEPSRTNQWYCSTRCRNTHNVWMFRHPTQSGRLDDVLP